MIRISRSFIMGRMFGGLRKIASPKPSMREKPGNRNGVTRPRDPLPDVSRDAPSRTTSPGTSSAAARKTRR
ncbi:MAG: hypothetical protein A2Z40_03675 [Deltaproteobacteria bacterium RBG_19FT_COMBO_60_16]|nr:MAG: hypothetical protein A2Z40_03675 [Deltaproteobacteria bacterium RBG_19FT_COMBO_60_16]